MRRWNQLPLRLRLTLVFAAGMAVVLAGVSVFVYLRTAADLLDTVDAGLRSRAEIVVSDVRARGSALADVGSSLIERDEAFAQVADATGSVVQSSPIVARTSLLPRGVIVSIDRPMLFDRVVPGIDNTTRVLAVPVVSASGRSFVIVGSSLQDREDQLVQLVATLAIGCPVALILISLAGWMLAGAALRPVERMRREASAISSTDPQSRLTLPAADDEIAKLGVTLNAMLDRIQGSVERERRLVDNASHELRTPLSILKAELELALARPRTSEELEGALRSAAVETDHLVRLADDLLVLARAHEGRLPVHGEDVALRPVLEGIARRHRSAASDANVAITVEVHDDAACLDTIRIRQALDDLLDNALRHTPLGGSIRLVGERRDGLVEIAVEDSGPGFSPEVLARAFEPFARGADVAGSGLGLAIVRVIAEAHGGSVRAENGPEGGARVTLVVRNLG